MIFRRVRHSFKYCSVRWFWDFLMPPSAPQDIFPRQRGERRPPDSLHRFKIKSNFKTTKPSSKHPRNLHHDYVDSYFCHYKNYHVKWKLDNEVILQSILKNNYTQVVNKHTMSSSWKCYWYLSVYVMVEISYGNTWCEVFNLILFMKAIIVVEGCHPTYAFCLLSLAP